MTVDAKFRVEEDEPWAPRGGRKAREIPDAIVKAVDAAVESGKPLRTIVPDGSAESFKKLMKDYGRREKLTVSVRLEDSGKEGHTLVRFQAKKRKVHPNATI